MMQYFDASTQLLIWGVLLPLLASNVAHMVLVKKNGLKSWSIPISERLFGANKTLRGLLFVPLANVLFFTTYQLLAGQTVAFEAGNHHGNLFLMPAIGAVYGAAYVLFELPNSWLKRRLGIAAGQSSQKFRVLFALLDKSDSALGVSMVFVLLNEEKSIFWSFFITAVLLHASISGLLVFLNLKKSF